MTRLRPAAVLLLTLASCAAPHVPEPTLEAARGDEAALRDLRTGRLIYVAKCSGCHGLYSVEEYSDPAWERNVQKMIRLKKVKLSEDERMDLLRYLTVLNGRE